jgi:spermidine synthase
MEKSFRKRFGLEEMMVHVPMCSHKDIKKVLVIGMENDNLKKELSKHNCSDITYSDDLNIDGIFDIILYNKEIKSEIEIKKIREYLEPNFGIFVCLGVFIYKDLEKAKEELRIIGKDFWICMPYSFHHHTLIFASNKFHPQAEIVLQVSDLLPNCNYYSTELHTASFVHPKYIENEITNIAKR